MLIFWLKNVTSLLKSKCHVFQTHRRCCLWLLPTSFWWIFLDVYEGARIEWGEISILDELGFKVNTQRLKGMWLFLSIKQNSHMSISLRMIQIADSSKKKKKMYLSSKMVSLKQCAQLKTQPASVQRNQRGLSVEQSDDCYYATMKCLEERLKQKSCAQGLVLTWQIEED